MKVKNYGTSILSIVVDSVRYQFSPDEIKEFLDKDEYLVDAAITPYPDLKVIEENTVEKAAELTTYQLKSERGAPLGYAPLDGAGKVPTANLPAGNGSTLVLARQNFVLSALDISNKYVDLDAQPDPIDAVLFNVKGGCSQFYGIDFTVISDGFSLKRLSWNGLGLEFLLEVSDVLEVFYNKTP